MAPEVDEIIPVSRGGDPYDLENVQLVHRKCNRAKSNKLPGDFIKKAANPAPVSRAW